VGTWISHLRVADELLKVFSNLDETTFIYGNLAPDSGIPNETWTEFDPPKEVTHFLRGSEGESEIRDLVFYREYLRPLRLKDDLKVYSFTFGYHCHLVCDIIWAKCIGQASEKLFAAEIAADKLKTFERIKDDWYDLDHVYLQLHPTNAFWRVVNVTPNPSSYLPFIKATALHHQLDYIRKFYGNPKPQWLLPRHYPYLNESTMARAIQRSTDAILYLKPKLESLSSLNSTTNSADLLPEEWLQPYDAPLGDNT
jgi:hypothetical protein